jgi:hypothetical protein
MKEAIGNIMVNPNMADQVTSSEPTVGIAMTQKQLLTIIDWLYYTDPDCGQSVGCVEIADKLVAIYADAFMKPGDRSPFAKDVTLDDIPDL